MRGYRIGTQTTVAPSPGASPATWLTIWEHLDRYVPPTLCSWEPVESPGLVALSWDLGTGLWGVEPDGTVHRRDDRGSAWQRAGRLPGQPEAILAQDGVLYAAALEDDVTGLYRSDDEGATWRLIYRDTP